MNKLWSWLGGLGACALASLCVCAARPVQDGGPIGGLVTLYARDPIGHVLCLHDGDWGGRFLDGLVKNRCSDLDYSGYTKDQLSAGIERDRFAVLLDIGSGEELQRRYGYEETVGGGQGFASIERDGKRLLILDNLLRNTRQALREGDALFGGTVAIAHAPVQDGHIYLLRTVDRARPGSPEAVYKLMVVASQPGEWVALRWQEL